MALSGEIAHLDRVDFSGLRTNGFEVDRGTIDHVSFRGAKATVAEPLSEQAASGRRTLVVPSGLGRQI